MTIRHLIDTSVLIRILRDEAGAASLLRDLRAQGETYVSAITRTEMLARMLSSEEPFTLALLSICVELPIDREVADAAGRLIFSLAKQGHILSVPDTLPAATALWHDLCLVSYNVKHFAPIGVLRVWKQP